MGIQDFFKKIIADDSAASRFRLAVDSEGLNFVMDAGDFEACAKGSGSGWMLHQYVYLKMLEEQGLAETIGNGFVIPSEHAVRLEPDAWQLLELPLKFNGSFKVRVRGETRKSAFSVEITPVRENGQEEPVYSLKGPCLHFTTTDRHMLSAAEYSAFFVLHRHSEQQTSNNIEEINLKLIHELQKAKSEGMKIDLAHFNNLDVFQPEKVGVSITQLPDGSGVLTPSFTSGATPDAIHNRLGQISPDAEIASLRVGDQIILLDDERLKATHEIIANRRIPAAQFETFLKTPSAFLDASLVDLDTGFSVRVKGATKFVYLPVGETDASGIKWFNDHGDVLAPTSLPRLIETHEELNDFEAVFKEAVANGNEELTFAEQCIDVSNPEEVKQAISATREKLDNPTLEDDSEIDKGTEVPEGPSTVLLEEVEEGIADIVEIAKSLTYKEPISLDGLKRAPFPHQEVGIRWLLGLMIEAHIEDHSSLTRIQGGLLADDMGLGKTYMSLVALSEYYSYLSARGETKKPVLMVAPLSLLENWEEEVDKTFIKSPFKDIVLLQSGRDLKSYRLKGAKAETKQRVGDDDLLSEDAIRYSLKVGEPYGIERLDMPGRLVLTTYQTLRDYQFSMCLIDWGVVVFDEAQNIKSPNTLQTRAAKGLKADFKLLATGTPVENSLADFWCIMDTAQPGLLGSWDTFRNAYIKPIRNADAKSEEAARLSVGQRLRNNVGAFMLRRLKEDQLTDMPKKNVYSGVPGAELSKWVYQAELRSQMNGKQLGAYDSVISGFKAAMDAGEGGQGAALTALHRLREISLHPDLSNEMALMTSNANQAKEMLFASSKLQKLLELLNQIRSRGEKVIIFLMTKKVQRLLKIWLEQIYGIPVNIINGDTKAVASDNKKDTATRKSIIERFEAQPGFGILIMSPIAAGVGLTIVGANNVIHLERHWNPAKEAQATDRVYRIGQTKDVNIYLPALHHPNLTSFDVNLDALLRRKTNLKDAVVTPQAVTEDEMVSVFG